MATINFTVEDHSIRVDNLIELAQGSNNFDTCAFSFDSTWDEFTLYAVMYQNPKNVFKLPLDEANTRKIPQEVLQKDGWVYIGARGEKEDTDETIVTSIVVKLPVRKGAVNGNETGQEMLDQSQYEYLLGKVNELNEKCESLIKELEEDISQLSEEKVDKTGITLATHTDGLIYLFVDGKPVGIGLDLSGGGTSTGLSSEIKSAIMTVVENIGLWKDGNGQAYIDNLRTALYNAPLSSITVVYTQSKAVLPTDELETLKSDLVVTGHYTDGSSAVVTDYTLSGSLVAGTSIITVAKDGFTATFEVTVSEGEVKATGITLDKTTLSFTGKTPIQLTATLEPSNSTDAVVWRSSENAVATAENGLVTPVSDGSCTIYATAGDVTAECSVSVALPLSGINIGNPFLTKVDGMPSSVATTEEEAQGKWYKALYTAWTKALNIEKTFFLHPFTNGTYYIRMVGRTLSDPIEFYAFQNADIGLNPTATLGKVGGEYTNATVTKFTAFDSEYINSIGIVDLGEWTYVDNSGTTYTSSMVALYKVVVPEDVYVFMATSEMGANRFPGISENYPYMNDLYTIFDSDPSANILQIVE